MEERGQYEVGDFVIPVDLPRIFVCYVTSAYPIGQGDDQLLELQPLDGPWPIGTLLIRMDHMVRAACPVEIEVALPARHAEWNHRHRDRQPSVDASMDVDAGAGRPAPTVA